MKDLTYKLNMAISYCSSKYAAPGFQKIYNFTTENIADYMKYFDLKDKKLLTVGSSGDQVLNAYYEGARDITLIDINDFSSYYLYLKISAILILSYEEFKRFFFVYESGPSLCYNEQLLSKQIFDKFKSTLKFYNYEAYSFFEELFYMFRPKDIKRKLMEFDETRNEVICGFNNYLKDEQSYNRMQKILYDISFEFINEDILSNTLTQKYDNIFLSNIICFYKLDEFKPVLAKLASENLSQNGKMLFAYIWNVDFNDEFYQDNWREIYKLPIVKEKLKEFITEYHSIKSDRKILHGFDDSKDLILVYKKS